MQIFTLISSAHTESFGSFLESLLEKDERFVSRIIASIEHVRDRGGCPQPPQAKPLKGLEIDLCEIRVHYEKENLLRIYYFVDKEKNRLVLLNTLIKPDGTKKASQYAGKAKKKLNRKIQKSIEIAIQMHKQYPKKTYYELLTF